jgi:hypothetical protein
MLVTTTARLTVDWLALAASGVLVFILGVVVGMWLLRVELRRNGWSVRLRVDAKDEK